VTECALTLLLVASLCSWLRGDSDSDSDDDGADDDNDDDDADVHVDVEKDDELVFALLRDPKQPVSDRIISALGAHYPALTDAYVLRLHAFLSDPVSLAAMTAAATQALATEPAVGALPQVQPRRLDEPLTELQFLETLFSSQRIDIVWHFLATLPGSVSHSCKPGT